MSMNRWTTSLFLLLSVTLSARALPRAQQGCAGCLGIGASSTASNGSGPGMVKVSLAVEPGSCTWTMHEEPLLMACQPSSGCATTVYREWRDLPAGSVVDFCIEIDEEEYCLKKKTIVDSSGSGSSNRTGPALPCSNQASDQHTFKVRSDAAGLEAEVTGQCSACQGDL